MKACNKIPKTNTIFFNLFTTFLIILVPAAAWCTDVIFLGPTENVYNGDTFTINLVAQKDMPDMILVDCKLHMDNAVVKITDYDAALLLWDRDQTFKIAKPVSDVVKGSVLTVLELQAVNTGRDFIGVYECTYMDSDKNEGLPLNYGILAPNVIYGDPSYYGNFDDDNDIDGMDITNFIATLPHHTAYKGEPEGDFNGDGKVSWQDLVMFASSFGANLD